MMVASLGLDWPTRRGNDKARAIASPLAYDGAYAAPHDGLLGL